MVRTQWRLPLRAWQQAAFETWNAERPADALIVATPGAGKTRFATRLAHAALFDGDVRRVVVVVPRDHLKAQFARAMAGASIELDHRFRNADHALAADLDGAVVTYAQVASSPRTLAALTRTPTLVVLDEIHHAGDQASWGQALRDAFAHARYRVALSGTPFRSDGAPIPFVRYLGGTCVATTSYDYAQALRDGVCRALVFPMHGGEAEWVSRSGETMRASFADPLDRAYASERLRTALTQATWLGDVIEKAHERLLAVRAAGHPDAGGLIAAMHQDHARFVAELVERRTGTRPEIVLSDLDDASKRIATFTPDTRPWIVAVHMISEGVDIPRLRVGVFASNVVSELYFRQFCGRFVRAGNDGPRRRESYVYLPDDSRLRAVASRITDDVRHALRTKVERDEVADALRAAMRRDDERGLGEYASIAATATEGHTLDFGPLFAQATYAATAVEPTVAREAPGEIHVDEPVTQTHAERREALRREVRALVARASVTFGVDHKRIHATLNERFGGPIAQATLAGLQSRRATLTRWLEVRRYDGIQ